jgi:hypothetical protein
MVLVIALSLLSSSYLTAQQTVTATLSGNVSDSSGAVLAGAKVTLTAPDRGISRIFTTDNTGDYVFSLLPPATYNLQVEATGFKTYRQTGISLAAGQTARQMVNLALGAISETVSVTTEAPLLNADNANISSDITARQVVELPLNLRNVYGLAFLNSSVNNTAEFQIVGGNGISGQADQDISFFNFGGTFFNTAAYLVDGAWDTAADWGGVMYVPAVDAVQEFKIQTNAFTAQYGWSSGNVINVVGKSGTNQIHGNVYDFYRNSALDAKNYFNGGAQPLFHRNQFGFTLGGPLWKDKTYFFGYYEGLRSATPTTTQANVPTQAMLGGDFSGQLGGPIGSNDALGRPILFGQIYDPYSARAITAGQVDPVTGLTANASGFIRDPFPGNIIPQAMWDSVSQKIVQGNYWPSPNQTGPFNFGASAAAESHSDEYSIRIDHNFTENTRIFGRWSRKYESKVNVPSYFGSSNPGGPGATNPNNRYNADVNLVHVFSPTLTMNANFGVTRWIEESQLQSFGFQASTLGLPSFVDEISPAFPQVTPEGVVNLGPRTGLDDYRVPRVIYTASDDFTKVIAHHTLSFGFTGISNQLNGGHYAVTGLPFPSSFTAGPDPQQVTSGTGSGFASFLVGAGGFVPGAVSPGTGFNQFPAMNKKFLGWYLQDDWKASRKLTLNLGLRYEIQTAPTERFNAQEYFDFNATNPISGDVGFSVPGQVVYNSGNNRSLYDTQHTNLAPRIGLAYEVMPKLVARAGFGVFFVPNYYNQGPNLGYSSPTPWVTSLDGGITVANPLSNPFPNGQNPVTGNALGGLTGVGFGLNPVVGHDRKSAYVQQWMGGVQYALTNNDLIDVTYFGNHGVHVLAQYVEWNQLPTADLAQGNALFNQVPNPFFGHITNSGCGLDQPTVAQFQLLRPYPEYCSVTEAPVPVGTSNYDALQVTYTRRWHSGLSVNVSYTLSKFTDNVQGASGWAFPGSGSSVRDFHNLAAEKSRDVSDIPHSLVVNYVYELPVGKGKPVGQGWSGPVNQILGGWQLTGIFTAKSGFPLSIAPAQNTLGAFGGNQRPNLIGDPTPANQSITNWINGAAFEQPDAFSYGDAPRTLDNLRSPHYVNWDMGIQKWWDFSEAKRLQFRLEMFNTFNHPNFFAPDLNLSDYHPDANGVNQGNFGKISQAYPSRDVQAAVKFYW